MTHLLGIAKQYFVAAVAAAAAFALALTLQHPWVTLSPFFVFYAAVAIGSWYGGTGPGLLATALGAVAADYYLLHPRGSLRIDHQQDVARLVLFALVGALIAALTGALRRTQQRCEMEADAARKSEARARRLAEANLIGVYFANLDGSIRWGNQEFLRLLGCTEAELRSGTVNWRDATAPEHRPRDENAIRELRECRVCTPFEKDHVFAGSKRVPVLVGCAMLDEAEDEVVGFVLDLTERKRAEAEIQQNQLRLQAMSSELMMAEERERRRIAIVLHDAVVQMLALSKLKVDGLRRGTGNGMHDRLTEVYELIEKSIESTRTLTADLSPPVLYELGLPAAIQWLGDRLRTDHGISFELAAPKDWKLLDEPTRVVLFQAVRELLINVAKHARASRCVVTLTREPDAVHLNVRDNGSGFSPSTSTNYGAGGLGLFNIRQRMEHLGGSINLETSPGGGGTNVMLLLPLGKRG